MRMMLARLFAGRNGIDQLNTAVMWTGLACWLLHIILPAGGLQTLLYYVFVVAVGIYVFRRNVFRQSKKSKRQIKNIA